MLQETEQAIRSRISARRMVGTVESLCSFGNRFVGAEGDGKSIEYVTRFFTDLGLELRRTPITVPTFLEDEVRLETLAPMQRKFEAVPPYFSPSSPEEGLTAEVVDVENGGEEDYKNRDVRGKIVVLKDRWGAPTPKFWMGPYAERAERHGAVGMILVYYMPFARRVSYEAGLQDMGKRFVKSSLPVVCISATEGLELMKFMGMGGLKVHLRVRTRIEDVRTELISGFLKGAEKPDERITIIAHRDVGIPPGANDNGSGQATMLEIARALSGQKPKRSVEFISSTAEEGVTAGAWNYARIYESEMRNIKALFNIDMISTGGRLNLVGKGVWPDKPEQWHAEWLNQMIEQVADELGYHFGRMVASWGVSESGRFLDHGVPSAWFWKPDDPYYHTREDTPDKLEPNAMKAVGDVVAITVWRLANANKIPP